jgi:uncharacterized protein YaaN involved in tellurite resistance
MTDQKSNIQAPPISTERLAARSPAAPELERQQSGQAAAGEVTLVEGAAVEPRELSPEEQARVDAIKQSIDVADTQMVLQYGLTAQNKISAFADSLLTDIRTRDTGEAGVALTQLLSKVRELDIDSLAKGAPAPRIPLIGKLLDGFKRFESRYEKLSASIERLTTGLERARMGLLKDLTVLDKMFELNLDYLRQLDLFIAAGEQTLEEINTDRLPVLEAQARTSQDPMVAQQVADFRQAVLRFERRLHDLKLTRTISIQTAPQIRLIQSNDQGLVEKIQTSVTNTIPLWKNQIVIALSLYRQQQALALQKAVTDTSNEILARNAEMLRVGSANVAREVERGLVDIETLRKVNDDLIATLEETVRIQEEGHARRVQAEVEIVRLESDLKRKLTELSAAGAAGAPGAGRMLGAGQTGGLPPATE